jgi:hypothetical protein
MFIKSSILKKYRYDDKFRSGQDFDLWLRLIAKGYKFDLLEEFLIKYRFIEEMGEKKIDKYHRYSQYDRAVVLKNIRYYWNVPYVYMRLTYSAMVYIIVRVFPRKMAFRILNRLLSLKDKLVGC